MEVQKFEYTKENGEVSSRELVILTMPNDLVGALDVTGLNPEQQQEVIAEYKAFQEGAQKEFNDKLKAFKKEHGVSFKSKDGNIYWKHFKQSGLKEVK